VASAAESAAGPPHERVRWGILGTARIATERVIPATIACPRAEVVAVASRAHDKARTVADRYGIPAAYGSYEELLADPRVDAIYNPLPNHLHVPWSIRALEAGKHVLCEKPVALDAGQARQLLAARDRTGYLVQEAAMVRTHPRWVGARELIRSGRIGPLRAVVGFFSYFNVAPENVRNQADLGGGGLLDVGFYPITMSRFLFEAEPLRVIGTLERDPTFGVDRLASALLEFPGGQATFTCATQLPHHQWVDIYGARARLAVEIPWSMPSDRPSRLILDDGLSLTKDHLVSLPFDPCDQWQVQCEGFCRAIQTGGPVPIPIEDAVANMQVIDAIFRSARSGTWEPPADS
jgi:predicted dehydrogenase